MRFDREGQSLAIDIAPLRISAAANARLSGLAFIQVNRAAHAAVGNVRLRYRFAEGRDFYLVYDQRLNTDRDRVGELEPELPRTQGRNLVFKYSHALVF